MSLEELKEYCNNSIKRIDNTINRTIKSCDKAIEDCHKTNKVLKLVPIVTISACVIMTISVIAMLIFKM